MKHAALVCLLLVTTYSSAQWQPGPTLSGASQRVHAAGVFVNGTLYAVGGTPWIGGGQDGIVHSLPLNASSWLTQPALETGPIAGLAAGLDSLGRIVTYGGEDISNGDRGPIKTYNPVTGETVDCAEYPSAAAFRYFASCTDGNGRLYVIGGGPGRSATSGNQNKSNGFRYDAVADQWTSLPAMSAGVGDAAGVYDGAGHVLVIGGVTAVGSARTSNVARLDLTTMTWSDTAIPDMPVSISGARAVRGSNGWIYVIGGETGPLLTPVIARSTWIYRPDLNAWHQGPDMAADRRYHMATLGTGDFIYVLGGESNTGPLSSCEKLYTPPPPQFDPGPSNATGWLGQTVALEARATGGQPLQYQWKLNGLALSDGLIGSASSISGANSATLLIGNAQQDVSGAYTVEVTNPSATIVSAPVHITLRVPPHLGSKIRSWNLHPGWATHSYGYGVDQGELFGESLRPFGQWTNLSVATLWANPGSGGITLSGPASAGGSISRVKGNYRVGWWWWPYQVWVGGSWQTAYSRQACIYQRDGAFVNLQVSGWEYSRATDTDGSIVVGSISTDDAVGNVFSAGVYWTQGTAGNWSPHQLGSGYGTQSSCNFLYANRIYGTQWERGVNFNGYHQGYWDMPSFTWHELTTAGASSFSLAAAESGQIGGSATYGGVQKATIWGMSSGSEFSVHPSWATSSSLAAVHQGVQAGQVVVNGHAHAAVWTGSAGSCIDLHQYSPRGASASFATGVEVQPDGTILVSGSISIQRGSSVRSEAVCWKIYGRRAVSLN